MRCLQHHHPNSMHTAMLQRPAYEWYVPVHPYHTVLEAHLMVLHAQGDVPVPPG